MKNNLSSSILYLLSISAGLVVANLYYNQPLLHDIALSLKVSDSQVSNVALSTQIGYAMGLLLIICLLYTSMLKSWLMKFMVVAEIPVRFIKMILSN